MCARDLKESVNCGLLLAKSGDTEMIKNFVLDRYAFFDEIDYGDIVTKNFSSRNMVYSEINGSYDDTPLYLVRHLDSVKFLRMLSLVGY